jgi:hypothetical protein
VENLPKVLTTLVKLVAKFATFIVDSGGAPYLANTSSKKIQNGPNGILWGWGETD